jgi:predicted deacylase
LSILGTLHFDSGKPGPALLILGAVHGNEKCGTHAIGRLVMEMHAGVFQLEAGKLVLAPICNPEAYRLDRRYIDANLNRVVRKHDDPSAYEHKIANELAALIDSCDYMLDLHSYTSGARPFLFVEYDTPEERAFAAAMQIPFWVTGWNGLYAGQGSELYQGDTCTYAFQQGKVALLVECGQHADPASAHVAYRCIRAALAHFGMAKPVETLAVPQPQVSRLHSMVVKQKEGKLLHPWQHLDPIKKGTPVIQYDDGEVYEAPVDGVVIMPCPTVKIGEEWIYFGVAA